MTEVRTITQKRVARLNQNVSGARSPENMCGQR